MFRDYWFLKVVILLVVLAVLLLGFYLMLKYIKKTFDIEKEHEIDEYSYHYDQINEKKEIEEGYLKKLDDVKSEIIALEKKYEAGVFLKNNIKVWQAARDLYEDLYRWKAKPFPIDETEVDFFLNDFEPVFKELGIEIIKPVVGQIYDPTRMKYRQTVSDPTKLDNEITAIVTHGYSLKLKSKTKVLQEAEVIINKKVKE